MEIIHHSTSYTLQWRLWCNNTGKGGWVKGKFLVWPFTLNVLMVFTVTSSDCKVKKARFYEFVFTLGWRLIGNTSLYKFPAPKHVSFRKYSSLNFRVFTVRETIVGMLSHCKKSLVLIFLIFFLWFWSCRFRAFFLYPNGVLIIVNMWISFSSQLNHTRGQYVVHIHLIAMKIS